jgi:class 3 adenylate cyclase
MRPSGVVAFLFTDVVDSTRLWSADRDGMGASLGVHDQLVRAAIDRHGGYVFATGGDGFCAAFARATDAVATAAEIQRDVDAVAWPGPVISVRIGVHLGEADERDGNYFGPTVNIAARVTGAGHGGQILVTEAIRSALGDHERPRTARRPPVQGGARNGPCVAVGDQPFPRLRSADRSNLPTATTTLVGRSHDVDDVRRLLADQRAVTITGAGGLGKTRLAIEVADAERGHWADGVHFVDLTTISDEANVVPAVARSIGVELRSDPTAELVRFVAGGDLLLVLDNCEHVVDACAELVTCAAACRGVVARARHQPRVARHRRRARVPTFAHSTHGARPVLPLHSSSNEHSPPNRVRAR